MFRDKELINGLYSLYTEELEEYKRMLIYTNEQSQAIKNDDFDTLEDLMEQKESVIKKIDQIENNLIPYKEVVVKEYQIDEEKWFSSLLESKFFEQADIDELKIVIKGLVSTAKQIYKIDQINRQTMVQKRNKLTNNMMKVKKGIKANNKYNNKVRIYSTFIDKKG